MVIYDAAHLIHRAGLAARLLGSTRIRAQECPDVQAASRDPLVHMGFALGVEAGRDVIDTLQQLARDGRGAEILELLAMCAAAATQAGRSADWPLLRDELDVVVANVIEAAGGARPPVVSDPLDAVWMDPDEETLDACRQLAWLFGTGDEMVSDRARDLAGTDAPVTDVLRRQALDSHPMSDRVNAQVDRLLEPLQATTLQLADEEWGVLQMVAALLGCVCDAARVADWDQARRYAASVLMD